MSKEQLKEVRRTKTTRTLSVPAYSDNRLVGWGECLVFLTNEAGIKAARADLTKANVIDLNRQIITDCKNDVRRGRSLWTALKKAAQANPALAKEVELLAKKYGFTVA